MHHLRLGEGVLQHGHPPGGHLRRFAVTGVQRAQLVLQLLSVRELRGRTALRLQLRCPGQSEALFERPLQDRTLVASGLRRRRIRLRVDAPGGVVGQAHAQLLQRRFVFPPLLFTGREGVLLPLHLLAELAVAADDLVHHLAQLLVLVHLARQRVLAFDARRLEAVPDLHHGPRAGHDFAAQRLVLVA